MSSLWCAQVVQKQQNTLFFRFFSRLWRWPDTSTVLYWRSISYSVAKMPIKRGKCDKCKATSSNCFFAKVQNLKSSSFTVIDDKEKKQIDTFKKLQPDNVRHLSLKIEMKHFKTVLLMVQVWHQSFHSWEVSLLRKSAQLVQKSTEPRVQTCDQFLKVKFSVRTDELGAECHRREVGKFCLAEGRLINDRWKRILLLFLWVMGETNQQPFNLPRRKRWTKTSNLLLPSSLLLFLHHLLPPASTSFTAAGVVSRHAPLSRSRSPRRKFVHAYCTWTLDK